MSCEKFNLVVEIFNNGPMEKVEEWIHDDFLFFKEYGMQDRDEWMAEIKGLVEGDFKFADPTLVAENEDVLVFNHIVTDENQCKFRVTAVNFLKNGQSLRLSTYRTQLED